MTNITFSPLFKHIFANFLYSLPPKTLSINDVNITEIMLTAFRKTKLENFVRLFLCESQSPIGTNKHTRNVCQI